MRKTESKEETEWQEITSFLVSHNVWENGTTVFISARHTVTLLITEDEVQPLSAVRVNQSIQQLSNPLPRSHTG